MLPTYIYGAGGLGREVHALMKALNRQRPKWAIHGFLDDSLRVGTLVNDLQVVGGLNFVKETSAPLAIVFAIADPKVKQKGYEALFPYNNILYPTLVSPVAFVDEGVTLEKGCLVMHHTTLSVGCRLGRGVLINSGTHLGSDCAIGSCSTLMPSVNLSSGVKVGNNCFIDTQAVIRHGVSIGDNSVVGICSLVLSNVSEGNTVMGQPAVAVAGQGTKE